MTFVIQPPGADSLLQAIDTSAINAESGGGVFAFASKGGVAALLKLGRIQKMLSTNKPFHLIIGVDAITNAETLLYLSEQVALYKGALRAHAFFHNEPCTFHPKFSWFKSQQNIELITGSGNLTLSGLGQSTQFPRSNWEAFTAQKLGGPEAEQVIISIDAWLTEQRQSGTLRGLNDSGVRDKAVANARIRYAVNSSGTKKPTAPVKAPIGKPKPAPQLPHVDEVLLRELPKTRPGQADVGRHALAFFGYEGNADDILIQYVTINDILQPAYEARLFVNASQNYRLELHGITDIGYQKAPNDDRMILVAVKLDQRSFRYTLVPVTSIEYSYVKALLVPSPANRRLMREATVTTEQLEKGWPNVPSNLLPILLPTAEP
jgi:hypothetical protein